MSTEDNEAEFVLLLTGQIETAKFVSSNNLYFKYSYVYGNCWTQITGLREGLSAKCQRNHSQNSVAVGLPIEATFTSKNPFGWPQLVLSCYGVDALGNDIVRGYGATHLPTTPGMSVRKIPMFTPESSSTLQKLIGWIVGRRPEFLDSKTVAASHGRLVTRVRSRGTVNLSINIILKDLKKFGYDAVPSTVAQKPDFLPPLIENKQKQVAEINISSQPKPTTSNRPPDHMQTTDSPSEEKTPSARKKIPGKPKHQSDDK